MRGVRGSLLGVMLLCVASAVAGAEAAPGVHFSGEILLSVRNPEALPVAALTRAGWTVQTLATVRTHDDPAGLDEGRNKTWLLLTPPGGSGAAGANEHPWDKAHRVAARRAEASLADLLAKADAAEIVEIEPVVAYEMRGFGERFVRKAEAAESSAPVCTTPENGDVVVCTPASFQWPNVNRISWHLDDDRTQLRAAQRRAAVAFEDGRRVRIAHLDTGYYAIPDSITPPHFNTGLSRSFIPNDQCGETGIDCYHGGTPNGHGPSTLSVLAGGKVKFGGGNGYPAYNDYVGGAPLAEVFTYRVSPSVILLWPMYIGQGIFSAIHQDADVISMSMGGAPSYFLRDAVNEAYDHGVPMFFAAADFFHLPIPILSIDVPPHTMVYPARFTTATPVSGITAAKRSYGLNPSCFTSVFRGDATSWMLRGSYGPEYLMKDRTLTAISPNITARYGTAAYPPNQIRLAFDGTSAATPQAAAAAALWLQFHRNDFNESEWRSWIKTQSAYDALTTSAWLPRGASSVDHFGAGVIQADKALDVGKPANPVRRPPGKIGFDWITLIVSIIGINPNDPPPAGKEAEIHKSMLQLEIAQLVTTEPALRKIVNGDFEHTPSHAQLARLARALERHERASAYLRRAIAKGPMRR